MIISGFNFKLNTSKPYFSCYYNRIRKNEKSNVKKNPFKLYPENVGGAI